jgi:hypothetical protein
MTPETITAHGTTYIRSDLVKERHGVDLFGAASNQIETKEFETLWDIWPKRNGVKVGKAQALTQYSKIIRSGVSETTILKAANAYAQKCGEMPKDLHRWLKHGIYNDFAAIEERKEQSPDVVQQWVKWLREDRVVFGLTSKIHDQLISEGHFSVAELQHMKDKGQIA